MFDGPSMELSLVWLNLIHTLPILIITNLSNSSSVIVRAFQVHYLVPFSKDKWTKLYSSTGVLVAQHANRLLYASA